MDSVCIDACLLGTERHLVCANSGYSWHRDVPDDCSWHLNGRIKPCNDRCLDTLFRLASIEPSLRPPQRFVNAMNVLGEANVTTVPWQKVMPAQAHRTFVKGIVDQVVVAMAKLPVNYFRGTWVPGNAVIRSLKPAKVDATIFQRLVEARVGNVAAVRTFAPDHEGFAEPVAYDRFGTLTGRLTVVKGPNILTLKREHRDMLVPSTSDGCIVSVDFAALEARVVLYEAGKSCSEPDLYGVISRELGCDRKAVKGAVISELYGSSRFALGKALGINGKELNAFVKKVRASFNTPELLKRIKSQFYATGKITNRYGRPVTIDEPQDNIFMNYYAQSTGVDVTLLGFNKIIERLAKEASGIRPLFLLHDALFLDVPACHVPLVESIQSVTVGGYVQSWPVKVERLSCTT